MRSEARAYEGRGLRERIRRLYLVRLDRGLVHARNEGDRRGDNGNVQGTGAIIKTRNGTFSRYSVKADKSRPHCRIFSSSLQ